MLDIFLRFRLIDQQIRHFLSYRASYSITQPRYKRSYVLNNWFSVSAMPVSLRVSQVVIRVALSEKMLEIFRGKTIHCFIHH